MGKLAGDPLAKRRGENNAQWKMRMAMAGVVKSEDEKRATPNAFAQMQGEFQDRFVTHVETGTKAKAMTNRGGSPICRWEAAKKLDNKQMAVVSMCQRLWRLAGLHQHVTANYGERLYGFGNTELAANNEIEAREDLKRLQSYFRGPLDIAWQVFENVARHGIPAGTAGAATGYDSKASTARALVMVQLVTNVVADREGI